MTKSVGYNIRHPCFKWYFICLPSLILKLGCSERLTGQVWTADQTRPYLLFVSVFARFDAVQLYYSAFICHSHATVATVATVAIVPLCPKFSRELGWASNLNQSININWHHHLKNHIWPNMMLLGWTETKLWILKYGSKSIQTSLILRQLHPKPYKLLKFFSSFVTTVKSRNTPNICKKLRWKSICD